MATNIRIDRDHKDLRIYINDILHLEIKMNNHDGLQSWYEGSKKRMYFIEFYRKNNNSITLEYDEFATWKKILELIDDNI